MGRVLGELVTLQNTAGLRLDGILYRGKGKGVTVVHVHGCLGNFYQNQFVRVMAQVYSQAGINFLSFNLSGHDGIAEGFRNGSFEYVGGSIVEFDECLKDIEGALRFVEPFSERIVLQGHSLGCDRVLHYLTSRQVSYDFILLSPCDSYQLQSNRIRPETVEHQITRLGNDQSLRPEHLVPEHEYGVSESTENYHIPISKRALLSMMDGPVFRLIKLSSPAGFFVESRCLVYIGGRDPLQTASSDQMFSYFEERVAEVTRAIWPNGDHDLSPNEEKVAERIVQWVRQCGAGSG